jgi:DNA repair exonuclease SbcCD ATPase subunit
MLCFMAVMAREAWTDERLDDLKENVNQRFDVVDRRFDKVDERFDKVDRRFENVDERFDKVDRRFEKVEAEMKAGFAEVNGRIDSLQKTMIVCFSGMTTGIVASIVGAILVTQL